MSNTRLLLLNRLTLDRNPGVLLKNGTGGGAPALIETAPYVMANLLTPDRYTLWKSSPLSTPTQYNVDFDLGAAFTIDTAAAFGSRLSSVGGFFLDFSTQTGAYTPGGTWTFQGSMGNLGLNSFRDDFVTFSPVANVRSVRFTISPSLANVVFSLGKFFVGSMTDLGGIHSPGGTRTPMKNRLEIPLPSGVTVISILGDDGMMFTHPWRSASSTVRDAWVQAFLQRGSIAFLDWEDHIYEVFLKDGQYTETKGFSNTWDIDVTLVRLP